jgi:hypothetical protein
MCKPLFESLRYWCVDDLPGVGIPIAQTLRGRVGTKEIGDDEEWKSADRACARNAVCGGAGNPAIHDRCFGTGGFASPSSDEFAKTSADESAPGGAVDPSIFASILTLLRRLPNAAAAFR